MKLRTRRFLNFPPAVGSTAVFFGERRTHGDTYSLASCALWDYSAPPGACQTCHPRLLLPVKITLNTSSIPEIRRPQVEALVKKLASPSEIIWLPSRFPRFVMLVEPGASQTPENTGGSIFESPNTGTRSLASVTAFLEGRIKACLAEPLA